MFACGECRGKAQKSADHHQIDGGFVDPFGGGVKNKAQYYFIGHNKGGREDANPRDDTACPAGPGGQTDDESSNWTHRLLQIFTEIDHLFADFSCAFDK